MFVSIMLAAAILPSDCPRGPMSVEKYRQYAPRVYQRPTISQEAHGRLGYMTRCQRSEWASREVRRLHKRLLRERAGLRVVWRMQRVVRPYLPWLRSVAACESNGRWFIATGNGFYGGLQFTISSWQAVGGVGYPHQASKLEQQYRGVRLLRSQGPGAWPNCS